MTEKKVKKMLQIEQIRSMIGSSKSQIGCLHGLGLGKIGTKAEVEDTPAVRGMINKIKHLISVKNI